jgi:hypothetical protein
MGPSDQLGGFDGKGPLLLVVAQTIRNSGLSVTRLEACGRAAAGYGEGVSDDAETYPEYDPATYDPLVYYGPTTRTFDAFLDRVLEEIPEFKPVAEEQIRVGGFYSTGICDALSTAAMQVQKRILEGKGSQRDEAIIQTWLRLAESAMDDPYVAESFLGTAGDDFLWDASGSSLHSRLPSRFRAELHRRYPWMITERDS